MPLGDGGHFAIRNLTITLSAAPGNGRTRPTPAPDNAPLAPTATPTHNPRSMPRSRSLVTGEGDQEPGWPSRIPRVGTPGLRCRRSSSASISVLRPSSRLAASGCSATQSRWLACCSRRFGGRRLRRSSSASRQRPRAQLSPLPPGSPPSGAAASGQALLATGDGPCATRRSGPGHASGGRCSSPPGPAPRSAAHFGRLRAEALGTRFLKFPRPVRGLGAS